MELIVSSLKKGVLVVKEQVKLMPDSPGVYRMLDDQGNVLYVGKAKSLPKRVASYANFEKLPHRLKRMIAQIDTISTIITETEAEAFLLEANLIKTLKPVYNICLRDDKSFPYIYIDDSHEFPKIVKYRGKPNKKGNFYGPFASAGSVNQAIAELQKIFLIRPCSDSYFSNRSKPCLQHQIHRCSAPCVGKINKEDYSNTVRQVKDFLSGKTDDLKQALIKEMHVASEKMEYEHAARIRDRISVFNQIQGKNIFSNNHIDDADIFGLHIDKNDDAALQVFFIRGGKNYGNKTYYPNNFENPEQLMESFIGQFYQRNHPPKNVIVSHLGTTTEVLQDALSKMTESKVKLFGTSSKKFRDIIEFAVDNAKNALAKKRVERIKNKANLDALRLLFDLPKLPMRIEVYDNSHNQSSNAVGVMVVSTPEGFNKNQYRVFNIKKAQGNDDYAMLQEVLKRRLAKLDDNNYPDLLLIDGGKGQLSAALDVVKSFGLEELKIVAISKGMDRNAGREFFHQEGREAFQLPRNDPTLYFLQVLRDEAHRFAIDQHRKQGIKKISASKLDSIVGIGKLKKKLLLSHFGSVDAIKRASVKDLEKLSGINTQLARKVLEGLK